MSDVIDKDSANVALLLDNEIDMRVAAALARIFNDPRYYGTRDAVGDSVLSRLQGSYAFQQSVRNIIINQMHKG